MRIAVISDTHFGYKWGSERGEDAFQNAEEAFSKSLDADLIILPGDIFDRKIPRQEVLDRATNILSTPMQGERTVYPDGELGIHGDGIPVVAIHGTHERRPANYTNPIQLMDSAGVLKHLDNETMVFEKDGEKVAVHGFSGVPERKAHDALKEFGPEPVEDAYNILVMHQSVEGFVYTEDGFLTVDDLPEGFDVILNGHIHWYNLENRNKDKPIIQPGSTVTTQLNKVEAEKPKGYLRIDTSRDSVEFEELENPREVNYIEVEAGDTWKKTEDEILEKLRAVNAERKPLVNLKLTGEADYSVETGKLKKRFADRMIISVNNSVETPEKKYEADEIDSKKEGLDYLSKQVSDEIDAEQLFETLVKGDLKASTELLGGGKDD